MITELYTSAMPYFPHVNLIIAATESTTSNRCGSMFHRLPLRLVVLSLRVTLNLVSRIPSVSRNTGIISDGASVVSMI